MIRRPRRAFWIWAAAVLGASAIAAGVWAVWFSPLLELRRVEVSGVTSLSAAEVERAADAPMATPLARVDVARVRAKVASLPKVAEAEVSRSWPNTLKIVVVERRLAFNLVTDGGYGWVDEHGVLFDTTAQPCEGYVLVDAADPDAEGLAEIAKMIPDLSKDLLSQIEKITVPSRDGIQLKLKDGRNVVWGSTEQAELKNQVASSLLATGAKTVDVSAPDRPATR